MNNLEKLKKYCYENNINVHPTLNYLNGSFFLNYDAFDDKINNYLNAILLGICKNNNSIHISRSNPLREELTNESYFFIKHRFSVGNIWPYKEFYNMSKLFHFLEKFI